jgi:predicted site-specific integrase-resolvase
METQARTLIKKKHAAALAGVNIRTIKRWAEAGRITEDRDPANGRPWYVREEIESIQKRHRKSS